jgi:ketosteroid isomerase-like protein
MRIFMMAGAAILALAIPAAAADLSPAQQQLVDLEAAWSKAMTQKDIPALTAIVAEDWTGQNDSGKTETRSGYLAGIKSGEMATASMSNHDLNVRLFHNIALVQGMDDEKSSFKGKDSSGTYTWMDVFEKRGGKWVAIASQVTRVTPAK